MKTSVNNGVISFTTEDGADTLNVTLHRTLRLPEDGKTHALPPSLGRFPVKRVEDYLDRVPEAWKAHGGVFFPMWQREAMWISFTTSRRPFVCKVAAGKINAVSGKAWTPELAPSDNSGSGDPRQDYLVTPPQPWLDGFNSGHGNVRQFVAMPLGMGYTVEGQVTGKEDVGGIQIMAVPPKAGLLIPSIYSGKGRRVSTMGLQDSISKGIGASQSFNGGFFGSKDGGFGASPAYSADDDFEGISLTCDSASYSERSEVKTGGILRSRPVKAAEMGLAQGGTMEQKIYPDPHGLDTWDTVAAGRMFIHIVNSEMYEQITGEKPPASPITAQTYAQHGYPWFKVWDEGLGDVSTSTTLAGVKTVAQKDEAHGFVGQQDNTGITIKKFVNVTIVNDGKW